MTDSAGRTPKKALRDLRIESFDDLLTDEDRAEYAAWIAEVQAKRRRALMKNNLTALPVPLVGQYVECPHCHRAVAIVEVDDSIVLARHDNRNNSGFCRASMVRADDESIACADGSHADCLGWVHGSHPPSRGICTCHCHRSVSQ